MKPEEKKEARRLRSLGHSLNEISNLVGISKSSASVWVSDVLMSPESKQKLRDKDFHHSADARLKGVAAIRSNKIKRWNAFRSEADSLWIKYSVDPIFMFGLALYIGEGDKRDMGSVGVANSDPAVIRKTLEFYNVLGYSPDTVTLHVHVHDESRKDLAAEIWRNETGIPKSKIKVYAATSSASRRKVGDRIPNGTCSALISNTELKQKIIRWMELALL